MQDKIGHLFMKDKHFIKAILINLLLACTKAQKIEHFFVGN